MLTREGTMRRAVGLVLAAAILGTGQPGLAQKGKKTKEPTVGGKRLGEWVKILQGKDAAAKYRAIAALSEGGKELKPAVPALIGVFRDSGATFLHPLAAIALSRIGSEAVADLRKG